jgi:uncharacterized membrane protein
MVADSSPALGQTGGPRRRHARAGRVAGLLVLLAAAMLCVLPGAASAESYSMPAVTIQAGVGPDGSMTVREARTFDFSGSFTRVYWYLDKGQSDGVKVSGVAGPGGPLELTDDAVTRVPGRYAVTDEGSRLLVQAFFALQDTSATFTLDYTVAAAAKKWDDTSELYWQFVGNEWVVPTGEVIVHIALPPGVSRSGVRAWGHGPLNGAVTINGEGSVLLHVDDLPAKQFVEARVLFPRAALPQAPALAGRRVAAVLAEEGHLAKKANSERDSRRIRALAAWALDGVAALAGLLTAVFLYVKFGREHRPQFSGKYFRDLPDPDLAPATVGALWRMGKVTNDDATATMLDLANRHVIVLERALEEGHGLLGRDHDTFRLRLAVTAAEREKLRQHERQLIELFFDRLAGADSFLMSDLRDLAKADRAGFTASMTEFRATVRQDADERGFLERTGSLAFGGALVIGGVVMALGFLAYRIARDPLLLVVGVAVGALIMAAAPAMRRRSPAAAELHAQYSGLYHYMKDFGRLGEKPPTAVVLWEHFLVLAVVFGIADQVIRDMQVAVPEVVAHAGFATSYAWVAGSGSGGWSGSALSSFGSSLGSAVSATSSSASGSGGGFSGSGGGGGGGGGGGAD